MVKQIEIVSLYASKTEFPYRMHNSISLGWTQHARFECNLDLYRKSWRINHEKNSWCWSKSIDLNEAQNLRHMAFSWSNVEQSAYNELHLVCLQHIVLT